ncbi:hypothetical protein [Erythrobacter sp. F6033]|uniref:hypothetical protein n=1 Tax=Erythrobacter sp. F6033 TaxID=2926401 RepID=UPI001FF56CB6|nr:hypothetical protein [Erythrobacter sp. F6033]MCK0128827.1 hypothetical protein [Erythrobacter sp. F6033]
MNIHPDIAALQGDTALQRRIVCRMQQAQREWRELRATRQVLKELELYCGGAAIEECPNLLAIASEHATALDFVGPFVAILIEAMRDEPLGEMPFRYRCSAGFSSVQILQHGTATINLVAYERQQDCRVGTPQSALFADQESREIVLTGTAAGLMHDIRSDPAGNPSIHTAEITLAPGSTITLDGHGQTRQITSVDGAFVMLQISRVPQKPMPSLEYRLSDGALLRTISGDKAASQRLMALSVLGALAGDVERARSTMESVALDQIEDLDVRWEAVRQILAADSVRGWDVLGRLANDPADDLAPPAGRFREQLLSQSPAFGQLQAENA